mgnify:CR=1 FL=1
MEEEVPAGSERILFIDDEPSIAKLGRLMLARLGYRVQSETNPQKALEIFAANPEQFDLPPAPQEISGADYKIEYISILAQASTE